MRLCEERLGVWGNSCFLGDGASPTPCWLASVYTTGSAGLADGPSQRAERGFPGRSITAPFCQPGANDKS